MTVYLSESLQMMLDKGIFEPIHMIMALRNATNPNHNSSTLWHGIDDALSGIIPMFFSDNMGGSTITKLIEIGWKDTREERD